MYASVLRLLVEHVREVHREPRLRVLMMKQFGNPRVCMPCSVAMPSDHFSVSVTPSAPYSSYPDRRV